jgi:hypothetical protein
MPADLHAAHQFIAENARVLERRCFDVLFGDGPTQPVRDAVAAYRNPDGGFAHGIEPDARTPHSQPLGAEMALRVLHQTGAWDAELAAAAIAWLAEHEADPAGVTFVLPTVDGWPHGPWWVPDEGLPPSLITTGLLAATLHARDVEHPWLDRATTWLYDRGERFEGGHPYEVRGLLTFLQEAPDRGRARRIVDERLAPLLAREEYVALDPEAPGEVHGPLEYAPHPDSLARPLFDPATIDAHLDHLEAQQREDGSWTFNWLRWSPAVGGEWDGIMTVERLRTLRANGRL